MAAQRPYTLTIAGFDPSGGAGILADIKTFEMLGTYGLAVATANTVQTDSEFMEVGWVADARVMRQLEALLRRYPVGHAKLGLIRDYRRLEALVRCLKGANPAIRIVWDPVLSTSSGYQLPDWAAFDGPEAARALALITPNWAEAHRLWPDGLNQIEAVSRTCPVLVKGGHRPDMPGSDLLLAMGRTTELVGQPFYGRTKHGTGCVLSAAITAWLARGATLEAACRDAKRYTERFIMSNSSNLGYHHTGHEQNH